MSDTGASDPMDELAGARYISLETYKKSGDPVRTPVWVVRMGDELAVWTDRESYKVKRLRRDPRFKVARCNASGKTILGPWHEGTARLIEDDAGITQVRGLLRDKYGWQVRAIELLNKLRRSKTDRYTVIALRF